MNQDIDAVEQEILAAAKGFSFIRATTIVDKNAEAIKARLHIRPDFFIQLYINVVTGTRNLALVLGGQRLYGRDCVGTKGWHRHPYQCPDEHDFSPEGKRPVSIPDFLAEVQETIEKEALL